MIGVVEPLAPPRPSPAERRAADTVDWRIVLGGALCGLAVIVPVTVARVVLDREMRDFDGSGWKYPLFVLILVAYFVAGWLVGRARPDMPLTHGALAGLGAFALWIPIRIVIWALREDGRGLFTGDNAALAPGQVLGAFVIAAGLAMLGGWIGRRSRIRKPTFE